MTPERKPAARKVAPATPPRLKAPLPPQAGVEPTLTAEAAILMDVASGRVLWQHRATERMYPASLTKMMTGLLAVESGKLDETFRASEVAATTGESSISLQRNESLTLRQALLAALIKSANDATVMVAESVAGSLPAFVDMMNTRAAHMGLAGTHFSNPHGLHEDDHYSTAADLAAITRQGLQNAEFARIVKMREAVIPWTGKPWSRQLVNRNRLLLRWEPCDGVKTGYTRQAGRCLAASATVDGWQLLCVVLKCQDSWADAEALLTWGPLNYRREPVARTQDVLPVAIRRGARRTVEARPVEDLYEIVKPGQSTTPPVQTGEPREAPIEPGAIVGSLQSADGATVQLVAVEAVPLSFWAKLSDLKFPQAGAAVAVLLSAGVLVHGASAKTARARRRRLAARKRAADPAGTSDDRRATGTTGE